ncbi:MAG: hypothetical protein V1725_06835 [archaeon]
MNCRDTLVEKLAKYSDVVITQHALEQAVFRNISLEEVRRNILHPERLVFAGKQEAEHPDEEKYDCYFEYSKTRCHRYVLVINATCIVCTIIKINKRWQKKVEKYAKH